MSEQSKALAIVAHTDPDTGWWLRTKEQAKILVPTGLLPGEINSEQRAIAVMMKGYELGLPRMYALSNIAIVKGKPTISAEAMLAILSRDYGKGVFRVKESTNDHCTVEWKLAGWDGTNEYTFSIEDAKQAGLAGGDNWRKYPAAMLRARAISAGIRMSYPECIAGMYTPGELGEEVTVTDEGVVLSAAYAEVADPQGAVPPPEPRNRQSEEKEAIKRLHQVMIERGFDDPDDREELHRACQRVARHFRPELKSLTELTATMVNDLATIVAEASDGDLALWATDWLLEIEQAATMDELIAIAKTFGALGITSQSHPDYSIAWKARSNFLVRAAA